MPAETTTPLEEENEYARNARKIREYAEDDAPPAAGLHADRRLARA